MLSYMIPGDDNKGLCQPVSKTQLQLDLDGDKSSVVSDSKTATTDSSRSDAPLMTPGIEEKPPQTTKPKLLLNGGAITTKHASLKRVSFGSSKGSMVETLVYESPLQEEEPESSYLVYSPLAADDDDDDECESARALSRVRVTFFESEKPLCLATPESSDFVDDFDLLPSMMASPSPAAVDQNNAIPNYARQKSTDSGWDNPFRPDGDLSREADEIVELIKEGKPITDATLKRGTAPPSSEVDGVATPPGDSPINANSTSAAAPLLGASAAKNDISGKSNKQGANGAAPVESVEVQRATVSQPADASQVQHVVLKKKPKCKCCVIQ